MFHESTLHFTLVHSSLVATNAGSRLFKMKFGSRFYSTRSLSAPEMLSIKIHVIAGDYLIIQHHPNELINAQTTYGMMLPTNPWCVDADMI